VCTIVAKNFLARARVFAQSFRAHNPKVPVHVLLTDEPGGFFDPAEGGVDLVELQQLDLSQPARSHLAFRYDRKSLAAAVKPVLLRHLLDSGFDRVVLVDADSMVLDTFGPVFEALEEHEIVLSPHRLEPPTGLRAVATELDLLRTGTFNGGLMAVRESSSTREFLRWWWTRLERHCRHDIRHGLHLDQKWLDLASGLFDGVGVLRHPGFNVAYWNLDHRGPGAVGVQPSAADWRCHHFHFSGYEPEAPDVLSSYVPDLMVADAGWARPLFDTYRQRLFEAGHHEAAAWPYAFGRFDNGAPVAEIFREIYHDRGDAAARHGDPFATAGTDSFWAWLHAPGAGEAGRDHPISNFWMEVYRRRGDVQREYPDCQGRNRSRFLEWISNSGLSEYGIPPELNSLKP
jgi:hypothetical protein